MKLIAGTNSKIIPDIIIWEGRFVLCKYNSNNIIILTVSFHFLCLCNFLHCDFIHLYISKKYISSHLYYNIVVIFISNLGYMKP